MEQHGEIVGRHGRETREQQLIRERRKRLLLGRNRPGVTLALRYNSLTITLKSQEFEAGSTGRFRAVMKLAKYTKFREERFGGVLFETRSEKVYSLNPSAAAIVREIAAGTDERHIVERLRSRYRDARDTLALDTEQFLAELRQKGLVED